MKANNLSICIPNKGCDKNCPYCVSRMTGYLDSDFELMKQQFQKVRKLAEISGVTSVLITGKGEPFLGIPELELIIALFKDYPLEIQTNGIWLNKNRNYIHSLSKQGMNVIAFSLDELEQFKEYNDTFKTIVDSGMLVRVTFNITDKLPSDLSFEKCIELCTGNYVGQFSLRNIVVPNNVDIRQPGAEATADWIKQHVPEGFYDRLVKELEDGVKKDGFLLRTLPYGATVYDYRGISVTYFDYCVQDSHSLEDIRSLIFQEDGHLYTNWNSTPSKLI